VTQLLFSLDGKNLLIRLTGNLQLHCLELKTMVSSSLLTPYSQHYFNDPFNQDLLLGLTFNTLQVLKWSDLSLVDTHRFGKDSDGIQEPVDRVVATADGNSLILSAKCPWAFCQISKVIIVAHPNSYRVIPRLPDQLPQSVLKYIRLSVSLISSSALRQEAKFEDTLVFVNTKFWVCT
jgi:hypothetical protein